uniref:Uncharacterized protein n=1 Tax=Rhizophagus irregularis (strain DAOM 181602 / DAOM 197198 / MUCL 43194) TaxID=747089 RepID=U9TJV7_RHIID
MLNELYTLLNKKKKLLITQKSMEKITRQLTLELTKVWLDAGLRRLRKSSMTG